MAEDGRSPLDGVYLRQDGGIDETCAEIQVLIGPRGIDGTQTVADQVVLSSEERVQHAQPDPPVAVHTRIVNAAARRAAADPSSPILSFPCCAGPQAVLGFTIGPVDLRRVPPVRDAC